MKTDILLEIDKDKFRSRLSGYTRQAYSRLPHMEAPAILDIGCGSGIPTIQLAIISKGKITAVDIDRQSLNILRDKIKVFRLSGHIKPVRHSLLTLHFKNTCFDIVWAEGSIAVIGFEKGIQEWRRFIKPGGFLVVHDEITNYREKMTCIPKFNYTLVHHFKISEHVWLNEYFNPLLQRIKELQVIYKNDPGAMKILDKEASETALFMKSPENLASLFYIMQKI
ncbi:MAG: methyltransferase domain-containing protein [Spirochaetales bacterium]|nr:methyltransferase domain-containing protein [Spirochaetales bacterium]